mmetsp:Transcript_3147/g.6025  ORF Transcript_3147/g.6025 Transcript_3147/m.6025 type:complete len:182 (-) Transcript_3147:448-993(-)
MIMKSSVVAIFACFFVLHFSGTVAYVALPLPHPHLAPTPMLSTMTTPTPPTPLTPLAYADTTNGGELLQMKQSLLGRVFRRGKNRLQTLEKETTATKKQKKDPEELWRVMFHNSEYMPERVSRVLTKVFPITRMTAFDICLRARTAGMVEVVVTDKKQAEKYCGAILRSGLTATIEPYDVM